MADANPLNKSLPAEVVSRRRPQIKKVVEGKSADEVEVELRAALANKPEARIKWLTRACEMAKNGRASSRDLFDIISNKKFTAGLPFKVGRIICSIAQENAMLFSDKQRRYMQSNEWILNAKYGADDNDVRDDEERGADDVSSRLRGQRVTNNARDDDDSDDEVPEPKEPRSTTKVDWKDPRGEELARREALERRLAAEERERRLKREQKKRQETEEVEDFTTRLLDKQPQKKQKCEEEVDAVDNILERLTQRQQPAEQPEPVSRRRQRRRRTSQSRSASAPAAEARPGRGRRRNGLSRSRSISVQLDARYMSPSPQRRRYGARGDSRDRGGNGARSGGNVSFEEALRRRMAQRDSEFDSSRIPVTWTRDDMRSGRHLQNRSKWGEDDKKIKDLMKTRIDQRR